MKEIRFIIELDAPVLATAFGGDPNANQSLPYIPGSLLRGAIASKLRSDALFEALILSNHVLYLNAYPIAKDGNSSLPIPSNRELIKQPEEQRQAKPDKTMLYFDPKRPSIVEHHLGVTYEINVHTARNRKMGRSVGGTNGGLLFRYEALADGQSFAGQILIDHTDPKIEQKLTQKLITSLKERLFLGGSQSADYGAVTIYLDESNGSVQSYKPASFSSSAQGITIYLQSDAIVRHPCTGQVGPYFAKALADILNIEPRQIDCTGLRYGMTGGFNRKWGLPIQQNYTVEKGSSVILNDCGDLKEKLVALAEKGIGERRNEGFGRIMLLGPDWANDEHLKVYTEPWLKEESNEAVDEVSDTKSHSFANQLNQRMAHKEIERLLLQTSAELAGGVKVASLSNSQVGRLRLRIRQEYEAENHDEGGELGDFISYLEGTKDRDSVNNQFRKAQIEDDNLRDWLIDLSKKPRSVWKFIPLATKVSGWEEGSTGPQKRFVGQWPYQVSPSESRQYAIQLIESMLTHIAYNNRRDA